jgi:uncharacterized protein YjiS (DUF1127 family)
MLNPLSLPTPHRTVIRLDSSLDATGRDTTTTSFVRAALLRIGQTLGTWSDRAAHRPALLELTDQHLADIGIDRQTARREAAKHFWQA